jgi:hypothetical protein
LDNQLSVRKLDSTVFVSSGQQHMTAAQLPLSENDLRGPLRNGKKQPPFKPENSKLETAGGHKKNFRFFFSS